MRLMQQQQHQLLLLLLLLLLLRLLGVVTQVWLGCLARKQHLRQVQVLARHVPAANVPATSASDCHYWQFVLQRKFHRNCKIMVGPG
jgi:hypothetical protein